MPDIVNESVDGLFVVDLRGFNLSEQDHKAIEQEIQNAVMRELAKRIFDRPGKKIPGWGEGDRVPYGIVPRPGVGLSFMSQEPS